MISPVEQNITSVTQRNEHIEISMRLTQLSSTAMHKINAGNVIISVEGVDMIVPLNISAIPPIINNELHNKNFASILSLYKKTFDKKNITIAKKVTYIYASGA